MSNLSTSNLFHVNGKVALVTGGGTGIGLMIAKGLAANGAKVYIGSRRVEVVKAAAETEGEGKLFPLELDVTNKESIRSVAELIERQDGRLDILINNAGIVGIRTEVPASTSGSELGQTMFDAESFDDWAKVWSTNVSSIFFTTMAFLGLLDNARKKNGDASVVNIGSISGVTKVSQNHFAYNASKAAVHHLTKMLSTEFALKGLGIRVNAIAPGLFKSELVPGSGTKPIDEEVDELSVSLLPVPARRVGREEEVAASVLYLVGLGGRYVTGQVIVVDGGFVAVNPSTA